MIKAIVFDFGNVICFPQKPEIREEMARLAGLPFEKFNELDHKLRCEYDRGGFDGKGYYKSLLAEAGIFPDDKCLEKITKTDQDGWKNMNPGTIKLMEDIQAAHITLGILSNMPYDFLAWGMENIPIFARADAAVFSCDYHLIKPEPAIYEVLRKQLDCPYGDIVFFDDLEDNIAKARELGIEGIVWNGPDAAREELEKRFKIVLA
ncbi:MAG: HAD family phosphatase [Treponema sp.]|jgi:HAD superfamily hydrolase (TIGR01509 family)|nr:HAD family phosphatase [Treponema sp.]